MTMKRSLPAAAAARLFVVLLLCSGAIQSASATCLFTNPVSVTGQQQEFSLENCNLKDTAMNIGACKDGATISIVGTQLKEIRVAEADVLDGCTILVERSTFEEGIFMNSGTNTNLTLVNTTLKDPSRGSVAIFAGTWTTSSLTFEDVRFEMGGSLAGFNFYNGETGLLFYGVHSTMNISVRNSVFLDTNPTSAVNAGFFTAVGFSGNSVVTRLTSVNVLIDDSRVRLASSQYPVLLGFEDLAGTNCVITLSNCEFPRILHPDLFFLVWRSSFDNNAIKVSNMNQLQSRNVITVNSMNRFVSNSVELVSSTILATNYIISATNDRDGVVERDNSFKIQDCEIEYSAERAQSTEALVYFGTRRDFDNSAVLLQNVTASIFAARETAAVMVKGVTASSINNLHIRVINSNFNIQGDNSSVAASDKWLSIISLHGSSSMATGPSLIPTLNNCSVLIDGTTVVINDTSSNTVRQSLLISLMYFNTKGGTSFVVSNSNLNLRSENSPTKMIRFPVSECEDTRIIFHDSVISLYSGRASTHMIRLTGTQVWKNVQLLPLHRNMTIHLESPKWLSLLHFNDGNMTNVTVGCLDFWARGSVPSFPSWWSTPAAADSAASGSTVSITVGSMADFRPISMNQMSTSLATDVDGVLQDSAFMLSLRFVTFRSITVENEDVSSGGHDIEFVRWEASQHREPLYFVFYVVHVEIDTLSIKNGRIKRAGLLTLHDMDILPLSSSSSPSHEHALNIQVFGSNISLCGDQEAHAIHIESTSSSSDANQVLRNAKIKFSGQGNTVSLRNENKGPVGSCATCLVALLHTSLTDSKVMVKNTAVTTIFTGNTTSDDEDANAGDVASGSYLLYISNQQETMSNVGFALGNAKVTMQSSGSGGAAGALHVSSSGRYIVSEASMMFENVNFTAASQPSAASSTEPLTVAKLVSFATASESLWNGSKLSITDSNIVLLPSERAYVAHITPTRGATISEFTFHNSNVNLTIINSNTPKPTKASLVRLGRSAAIPVTMNRIAVTDSDVYIQAGHMVRLFSNSGSAGGNGGVDKPLTDNTFTVSNSKVVLGSTAERGGDSTMLQPTGLVAFEGTPSTTTGNTITITNSAKLRVAANSDDAAAVIFADSSTMSHNSIVVESATVEITTQSADTRASVVLMDLAGNAERTNNTLSMSESSIDINSGHHAMMVFLKSYGPTSSLNVEVESCRAKIWGRTSATFFYTTATTLTDSNVSVKSSQITLDTAGMHKDLNDFVRLVYFASADVKESKITFTDKCHVKLNCSGSRGHFFSSNTNSFTKSSFLVQDSKLIREEADALWGKRGDVFSNGLYSAYFEMIGAKFEDQSYFGIVGSSVETQGQLAPEVYMVGLRLKNTAVSGGSKIHFSSSELSITSPKLRGVWMIASYCNFSGNAELLVNKGTVLTLKADQTYAYALWLDRCIAESSGFQMSITTSAKIVMESNASAVGVIYISDSVIYRSFMSVSDDATIDLKADTNTATTIYATRSTFVDYSRFMFYNMGGAAPVTMRAKYPTLIYLQDSQIPGPFLMLTHNISTIQITTFHAAGRLLHLDNCTVDKALGNGGRIAYSFVSIQNIDSVTVTTLRENIASPTVIQLSHTKLESRQIRVAALDVTVIANHSYRNKFAVFRNHYGDMAGSQIRIESVNVTTVGMHSCQLASTFGMSALSNNRHYIQDSSVRLSSVASYFAAVYFGNSSVDTDVLEISNLAVARDGATHPESPHIMNALLFDIMRSSFNLGTMFAKRVELPNSLMLLRFSPQQYPAALSNANIQLISVKTRSQGFTTSKPYIVSFGKNTTEFENTVITVADSSLLGYEALLPVVPTDMAVKNVNVTVYCTEWGETGGEYLGAPGFFRVGIANYTIYTHRYSNASMTCMTGTVSFSPTISPASTPSATRSVLLTPTSSLSESIGTPSFTATSSKSATKSASFSLPMSPSSTVSPTISDTAAVIPTATPSQPPMQTPTVTSFPSPTVSASPSVPPVRLRKTATLPQTATVSLPLPPTLPPETPTPPSTRAPSVCNDVSTIPLEISPNSMSIREFRDEHSLSVDVTLSLRNTSSTTTTTAVNSSSKSLWSFNDHLSTVFPNGSLPSTAIHVSWGLIRLGSASYSADDHTISFTLDSDVPSDELRLRSDTIVTVSIPVNRSYFVCSADDSWVRPPKKSEDISAGSMISAATEESFEEDPNQERVTAELKLKRIPEPISQEVVETVESVAVASTAVSAALSNPTTAMQQARVTALMSLSACEFSHTEEMGVTDSPLGLRVGSKKGYWYRGALVGNGVIFLSILTLCTIFTLLMMVPNMERKQWRSMWSACGRLHLPGVLIVPILVLLQGTTSAATALLMHGEAPLDKALSSFTYITLFVIVAAVAWVCTVGFKAKVIPRETVEAQDTPCRRLLYVIFLSKQKWIDDPDKPNSDGFKMHYQQIFYDYRSGWQMFVVLEVLISVVVGIFDGLKLPGLCKTTIIVLLVALVLQALGAVIIRPFIAPFETFFHISISLLTVCSAGLVLATLYVSSPTSDDPSSLQRWAETAGLVADLLSSIKVFFDMIMLSRWFYSRYNRILRKRMEERRLRKQQKAMQKRHELEQTHLEDGGDGGAAPTSRIGDGDDTTLEDDKKNERPTTAPPDEEEESLLISIILWIQNFRLKRRRKVAHEEHLKKKQARSGGDLHAGLLQTDGATQHDTHTSAEDDDDEWWLASSSEEDDDEMIDATVLQVTAVGVQKVEREEEESLTARNEDYEDESSSSSSSSSSSIPAKSHRPHAKSYTFDLDLDLDEVEAPATKKSTMHGGVQEEVEEDTVDFFAPSLQPVVPTYEGTAEEQRENEERLELQAELAEMLGTGAPPDVNHPNDGFLDDLLAEHPPAAHNGDVTTMLDGDGALHLL